MADNTSDLYTSATNSLAASSDAAIAGSVTQTIAAARNGVNPTNAKLSFPTGEELYYGMVFRFKKTVYDDSGSKALFSQIRTDGQGVHIFLPLPVSGIVESQAINYENIEMGVVGAMIKAGAYTANSAASAYLGTEGNSDVTQTAVENGRAATYAVRAAASLVPQVGAYIDLQSKSIVNPYSVALFKGTSPRAHQFEFRLIPRSQADSDMIKSIIDQFKYHALPSRGKDGLFLGMPDEVEMAFWGTPKLFKFARCIINNIVVNYSPFGPASFYGKDGSATAVSLTLGFQEIEQLTRNAYQADGVVDNTGNGG